MPHSHSSQTLDDRNIALVAKVDVLIGEISFVKQQNADLTRQVGAFQVNDVKQDQELSFLKQVNTF
jgi:hypothetical protein